MDKPISMSVKDFLIRKLAVQLMMSEKTIESVINHQFQSANLALQENDSVEISGFGKLLFNRKKAEKRLEKMFSKKEMFEKQMNDSSLSEQKRNSAANKLANTLQGIETLKPRIYGFRSDLRGMEEQVDSFGGYEGDDSSGEQEQIGDLQHMQLPVGGEEKGWEV
jgi:nucleoid DNA-binding protein